MCVNDDVGRNAVFLLQRPRRAGFGSSQSGQVCGRKPWYDAGDAAAAGCGALRSLVLLGFGGLTYSLRCSTFFGLPYRVLYEYITG